MLRMLLMTCALLLPQPALAHLSRTAESDAKTAGSAVREVPYATYVIAVEQALQEAHKGDPRLADRTLTNLLSSKSFAELPAEQRHQLLATSGQIAMRLDQPERAHSLLQLAVDIDPDHMQDWVLLTVAEAMTGEAKRSATYMSQALTRWPEALLQFNDELVFHAYAATSTDDGLRMDLLMALFDARQQRRIVQQGALWYQLAVMLVERGELERSRAIAPHVDSPLEIVKFRCDRRFDRVIDHADPAFDVALRAQQYVAQTRASSDAQPTSLMVLIEHLSALDILGRDDDIVRLSSIMLAEIEAAGSDLDQFLQFDDLPWVMNHRADALLRLGRTADGLLQLQLAGSHNENGELNVSQRLNLAMVYTDLQRPKDALQAIQPVQRVSDYGRMVLTAVQFRAARLLGEAAAEKTALRYIRKHQEVAPAILMESLLISERYDEAARRLIKLLKSPEDRVKALLWLQEFQSDPQSPNRLKEAAGWQAMRQRTDVKRAVAAVGRIEKYSIRDTAR